MSTLLQGGSLVLTVLGLVCGVVVLVRRRDVQLALAVLLEFLLAAGLLRLSNRGTGRAILAAALIVVIRALVSFGLRQGSGPGTAGYRSEPGGGEGPAGGHLMQQRVPGGGAGAQTHKCTSQDRHCTHFG